MYLYDTTVYFYKNRQPMKHPSQISDDILLDFTNQQEGERPNDPLVVRESVPTEVSETEEQRLRMMPNSNKLRKRLSEGKQQQKRQMRKILFFDFDDVLNTSRWDWYATIDRYSYVFDCVPC